MRNLKATVADYIEENNLLQKKDKILVAVSGGRDSMVLLHVLKELGYQLGIAHCNFGLRAAESDEDEKFVKTEAEKHGIPFWIKRYSTVDFNDTGLSIQTTARDMRYNWFGELVQNEGFDKLAVAHHAQDALETMFINLIRGTGLRGLGINSVRDGWIVRPLLGVLDKQMNQYVVERAIQYREDSSNASEKYLRNRLRHNVIPELIASKEGAEKGLLESLNTLSETQKFINEQIEQLSQQFHSTEGNYECFDLIAICQFESREFLLFELMRPFGFNKTMVLDMIKSCHKQESQEFKNQFFEAICKNGKIFVRKKEDFTSQSYNIAKESHKITSPVSLTLSRLKRNDIGIFEKTNNIAYFDYHKLEDNLVIRKWRSGDAFVPLGMKGKKKLSDLFIDLKLNQFQKQHTWILESKGRIIWVMGLQQDNTTKIENKTSEVLRIELEE